MSFLSTFRTVAILSATSVCYLYTMQGQYAHARYSAVADKMFFGWMDGWMDGLDRQIDEFSVQTILSAHGLWMNALNTTALVVSLEKSNPDFCILVP